MLHIPKQRSRRSVPVLKPAFRAGVLKQAFGVVVLKPAAWDASPNPAFTAGVLKPHFSAVVMKQDFLFECSNQSLVYSAQSSSQSRRLQSSF